MFSKSMRVRHLLVTLLLCGGVSVAAPTITSISPSIVTASTLRQPVTIRGTGFTGASTVTLRNRGTGETFLRRPISCQTGTRIVINPILAEATWSVEVRDPDGTTSGESTFVVVAGEAVTRTRAAAVQEANRYAQFPWVFNESNQRASDRCESAPGIFVSPYIKTSARFAVGATITGLAYEWGGFSDTEEFVCGLEAAQSAGNVCIQGTAEKVGAVGLDCSGLVSRAWALSGKYNTSGLADNFPSVMPEALRTGDVLVWRTKHARLFRGFDASGMLLITESSVDEDKVRMTSMPWSQFARYVGRRSSTIKEQVLPDVRISRGLTLSPGAVVNQGQQLTCAFDLMEGYSVATVVPEVACAVVRADTGAPVWQFPSAFNVELGAFGTQSYSGTDNVNLPPGRYRAVGRIRTDAWRDLTRFARSAPVTCAPSDTCPADVQTTTQTDFEVVSGGLVGLDVTCPATMNERTSASCTARAIFDGGATVDVTPSVAWSENSTATSISTAGVLSAMSVTADRVVSVTGRYSSSGVAVSDTAVVTVRNIDPSTPTNPSPGSTASPGPILGSTSVTLSWGASAGAVYYDFSVMDVTAGTPGTLFLKDQSASTTVTVTLSPGRRYRWRVLACNIGCSTPTGWRYFQTPSGGGAAAPTVSSIAPLAMTADGQPHVLTINGGNFVAGNIVQFRWGVGAGAGVWNTGNAPSISSSSLMTVSMNPGTVNDVIFVRVCRSATQTADSDCSSGAHAITVTAPVANPFIRVADVVVGEREPYAEFVIRLSAPSSNVVSVNYRR